MKGVEWYNVVTVVKNQKGEIIWEHLDYDFEAMNDRDAQRKMDNKYREPEHLSTYYGEDEE